MFSLAANLSRLRAQLTLQANRRFVAISSSVSKFVDKHSQCNRWEHQFHLTHAHIHVTHAHTCTHAHEHTHAHTRTHAHTQFQHPSDPPSSTKPAKRPSPYKAFPTSPDTSAACGTEEEENTWNKTGGSCTCKYIDH